MIIDGKKFCPNCKKNKNISEFSKAPKRFDGLRSYCKECDNKKRSVYNKNWYSDKEYAEKMKTRTSKYHKNNPHISRESSRRRDAQKIETTNEKLNLLEIFERDEWICHICGKLVDKNLIWPDPGFASHDHVIPLSKGGTHTFNNVKLAHLRCNLSKNAKLDY